MVIKMPLCQCDIDITGLADRLAIIERFQNCKQARVLLQQPGQPIENFGAGVPALGLPYRLGVARRFDGAVHIRLSGGA